MHRHRDTEGRIDLVTMTRTEWDHTDRHHKRVVSGGGHTALITDPVTHRPVTAAVDIVPDGSPLAAEDGQ